ncbi:Uncharacterised protein [Sphingobacterium multivorum]|jgi:hypothetical protein|uniref:Uncharacterized protein n=1 Tax=Sphingobacterium multivorum TaxID=28454 RepID=A0A2X2JJL7_SPHMU|nr:MULTISPECIES: hypothetical protein [Sphingobacterium]QRQ59935.1 hypothetical protein I6J33_17430 [Sphingobacterium multivorum]SPZ92221.1 Uncharacterised protein [Sphingobacterium multivorum]
MQARQKFRIISICLLFVIQALFLVAIFVENTHSYIVLAFIGLLSLLILYSYLKSPIHHHRHEYESIKIAIWVPVGAIASYYFNQIFGLGPVLGAALTGTIASFIPNINKNSSYLPHLPAAIYCGAFVGMSNAQVAHGFSFILAASIFTAIFLIVSKSLLNGVGGKLGTLAFLGVSLTYLLLYIFK